MKNEPYLESKRAHREESSDFRGSVLQIHVRLLMSSLRWSWHDGGNPVEEMDAAALPPRLGEMVAPERLKRSHIGKVTAYHEGWRVAALLALREGRSAVAAMAMA